MKNFLSKDDRIRVDRLERGILAGAKVAATDGDNDLHVINALAQALCTSMDICLDAGIVGPSDVYTAIERFKEYYSYLLPKRMH